MDQDMPHRISAPSRAAGAAPRYSLVWKMIWFPANDATLGPERAEGGRGGVGEPGLCRPQWGEPLRLGSAGQLLGRKVWGG